MTINQAKKYILNRLKENNWYALIMKNPISMIFVINQVPYKSELIKGPNIYEMPYREYVEECMYHNRILRSDFVSNYWTWNGLAKLVKHITEYSG